MHPLKAPGPDGFPALFFQKYWNTVGPEVYKIVIDIISNNEDPTRINNTYISLIPKCNNLLTPKYFRLISLWSMVMKVVTKTISNRLKHILPEVIDEKKSVFTKGRIIKDNPLITVV